MSDDLVKSYQENGYVTGIPILKGKQVERIRRLFNEVEKKEGREKCMIGLRGRHVDIPFVWELATHPAILDCIEALMGPNILVLSTHFFCKYPGPDKWVAWHQDVTYWGLEPPDALTAWYAVDQSDAENGCMRVIPGSHRLGILDHGKAAQPGNLLSINQQVRLDAVDETRAVDLCLKAGQISIHHGQLIHGSNPNRSDRRRCGLTIRYVAPHVKPVAESSLKEPWPAVVARGEDLEKNFGETQLNFH
ncbi:MAG: phytanoyl-CoA dioxygenase family protein [Planctomycetes bacterium]|nr:phytanoyl-CoA dioxygenase family protein [Planctomycetota bacterium]